MEVAIFFISDFTVKSTGLGGRATTNSDIRLRVICSSAALTNSVHCWFKKSLFCLVLVSSYYGLSDCSLQINSMSPVFVSSRSHLKCFDILFVFSLSASGQDDPQLVPNKCLGGYFPGEALEKCGQPLCVRLLLWGAGARHGARERTARDPHAASLPYQCAQASHLLRGSHSERGAAALRHRVSAQSCRHVPGWAFLGFFFLHCFVSL